jgi:hypothetical protein
MPMFLLNVDADFGIVEEWPLERGGDVSNALLLPNRLLFPVFTDRSEHSLTIT